MGEGPSSVNLRCLAWRGSVATRVSPRGSIC
jgi:hypothetical protein